MTITTATITALPTGTWTVDPAHTEVGFTARHLMITKVRGQFTDVRRHGDRRREPARLEVQPTSSSPRSTPATPTAMPT